MVVAPIVEGHGEVAALPVLLRRIATWRSPDTYVEVAHPIRVHRDRFLNREAEFSRHLQLAGNKCGPDGMVLVLIDADDDCPALIGPNIHARARAVLPHIRVSVVVANREFEAWFIGAAESLNGHRGLHISVADLAIDPEEPRNAKGWLGSRMSEGYGETTDQPSFAAEMDMGAAHDRCRSFRKLCDEWDKNISTELDA